MGDDYVLSGDFRGAQVNIKSVIGGESTTPVLTTPFNLPPDLPDFVGRQAQIDQVRECLDRGGAVAISGLHGMGGVGKTALALHVAHALVAEGRFRDAQLYLDLKGTDPEPVDPAAALRTLLAALLGPDPRRPQDVDTLAGLWRGAVCGKDALLILDNAAGSAQVRPLLLGCDTCAVLVTSRQRFALPGARRLDVAEMQAGEARDLLRRLAPGLGTEEADEIAGLCGRLPLALRVAGNYLALNDDCPPARYAGLLADERARLARLRDPDDPNLDVAATINLSVEQLDGETRRDRALLALLPAPFDGAAAAALWNRSAPAPAAVTPPVPAEVLDRLQALRYRSLVAYDVESGRYHQHDLLRLAAAEALAGWEEDEVAVARERLARHFLSVAKTLVAGHRYLDLDPDWPHLHAALEYADGSGAGLLSDLVFALSYYWSVRGMVPEDAVWCRRAAEACAVVGDRPGEGAHMGNLGNTYVDLGEAEEAIEVFGQALTISREIGNRRIEGMQLGNLGLAYAFLGQARQAIEYYERALVISRESGDWGSVSNELGNLGSAYHRLGEMPTAIECYEQALAISLEMGDRRGEGAWLGFLGLAYVDLGAAYQAIPCYERALVISRGIGDRRGEAKHIGCLGIAYAALGEFHKAIECYEEALTISREITDRFSEGNQVGNLGLAYAALGENHRAIKYYEEGLIISREIGDRRGEGTRLASMGQAYADLGEPDRARSYLCLAQSILEAIQDPRAGRVREWLADLGTQ